PCNPTHDEPRPIFVSSNEWDYAMLGQKALNFAQVVSEPCKRELGDSNLVVRTLQCEYKPTANLQLQREVVRRVENNRSRLPTRSRLSNLVASTRDQDHDRRSHQSEGREPSQGAHQ